MKTIGHFALLLASVWGAACGGRAAKGDGTTEQLTENIRQSRKGDEKVTEYDLNHDKKPDVWSFTVKGKDAEGKDIDKLVRKELDINWDSKVDISRVYGENEQVERESMDLDFDGKIDQVNFYE